ncbi:hypothetical protein M9H77_02407 [Catharanthus roseus]|uniref:Uncharacterized protein n=1 Tax=Catharanthus roseus TaxID=4058 RepID=A0ACC0C8E8_CATRO|nr:hypothetical protein M9H77_02407 [Catharanthus roseus]
MTHRWSTIDDDDGQISYAAARADNIRCRCFDAAAAVTPLVGYEFFFIVVTTLFKFDKVTDFAVFSWGFWCHILHHTHDRVGFVPCYYHRTTHDENLWQHDEERILAECAASLRCHIGLKSSRSLLTENNLYHDMIFVVAVLNILFQEDGLAEEPPNLEAKKFFDMLTVMETLLVDRDDRHSVLSTNAELLYISLKPNGLKNHAIIENVGPLVHDSLSSEESDINVETYFEELQNDEIEIEWDSNEDFDEDVDDDPDEDSKKDADNDPDDDSIHEHDEDIDA